MPLFTIRFTMRRIYTRLLKICLPSIAGVVLIFAPLASADSSPDIVISQFKITSSNGQFFTLYNAGSQTLDMSKIQLEYFNNYDLSKATSSKLISLTGSLAPHAYYMVSDSNLLLCYQMTVNSVSLGLSSTAGMVEVLGLTQSAPGSSAMPVLEDYVAWSKTAAKGAQTLPTSTDAFLQRSPIDSANNPLINTAGAGTWQAVKPGSNPCSLVTATSTPTPVQTGLSTLLPATQPPVTILNIPFSTDPTTTSTELPAGDIGLMAPVINEVLPNPAGTGTDSTDEFVEIYNPNPSAFDLSGFELQAGTTVLHKYLFPGGASLPGQSFTAFYSSTTGLSLSNSGGQVALLDPSGNSISASQPYADAADGQTWDLANGNWYWTTKATPGTANVIDQPVAKAKPASTTSKPASTGKVKGAKTTKASAVSALKPSSSSASITGNTTPVHFRTLALVIGLALLYGVYEYRADLGNFVHKFRKHHRTRRRDRA